MAATPLFRTFSRCARNADKRRPTACRSTSSPCVSRGLIRTNPRSGAAGFAPHLYVSGCPARCGVRNPSRSPTAPIMFCGSALSPFGINSGLPLKKIRIFLRAGIRVSSHELLGRQLKRSLEIVRGPNPYCASEKCPSFGCLEPDARSIFCRRRHALREWYRSAANRRGPATTCPSHHESRIFHRSVTRMECSSKVPAGR
jgi:hypothetical protein